MAYFWTLIWWLIVVGAFGLLYVGGRELYHDWRDGRRSTDPKETP